MQEDFLVVTIHFLLAQNAIGERRLLNDLLSNYDPRVRPVTNFSVPIDIGILFILSRIESLVGRHFFHFCVSLNNDYETDTEAKPLYLLFRMKENKL